MTTPERREKARLRSERWRRAHGIMPRRPAQRPWEAMRISRSTYYRRRAKARQEAARASQGEGCCEVGSRNRMGTEFRAGPPRTLAWATHRKAGGGSGAGVDQVLRTGGKGCMSRLRNRSRLPLANDRKPPSTQVPRTQNASAAGKQF